MSDCGIPEADELAEVDRSNNSDDLLNIAVDIDNHYTVTAREAAAEKLLKMWEDGNSTTVKLLDHIYYLSELAEEPYRSKANKILDETKEY